MAQVRAGVRLRKALCAVLEHPSVSHRFEGTGVTILEVRMARDFKKAHVRWTVADGGDDDEDARPGEVFDDDDARNRPGVTRGFPGPSSFSRRKRSASAALRREATRLRSMASKMLRSKHTPRLVFVDDDAKSAKERELDAAFARAAEAEARATAAAEQARETLRRREEERNADATANASTNGILPDDSTTRDKYRARLDAAAAEIAAARGEAETTKARLAETVAETCELGALVDALRETETRLLEQTRSQSAAMARLEARERELTDALAASARDARAVSYTHLTLPTILLV